MACLSGMRSLTANMWPDWSQAVFACLSLIPKMQVASGAAETLMFPGLQEWSRMSWVISYYLCVAEVCWV